jgi:glyoxylate reductase
MLLGADVWGATLGIVGMGRIGRAVARRARGFQMHVLYANRRRDEAAEAELGVEFRSFDDLLRESDFVSIHAPLTNETRRMFGAAEFRQMKRSAILINSSRGPIVDQAALAAALRSGEIAAAGLDVTDPEPIPLNDALLSLPNCVILPHIGSASVRTRNLMAETAAKNLLAALEGRRPPNPVNPEVIDEGRWRGMDER